MSESAAFLAPQPERPAVAPLIARLVEQFGAAWLDTDNLDAWLAAGGDCLLLLAGDPVRYPEALDVAVVLPELKSAVAARHGRALRLGVARREAEEALAARFALRRWPTLVWLRDGGFVTAIDGMHDWDDYLRMTERALSMDNTLIPLASAAEPRSGGCH